MQNRTQNKTQNKTQTHCPEHKEPFHVIVAALRIHQWLRRVTYYYIQYGSSTLVTDKGNAAVVLLAAGIVDACVDSLALDTCTTDACQYQALDGTTLCAVHLIAAHKDVLAPHISLSDIYIPFAELVSVFFAHRSAYNAFRLGGGGSNFNSLVPRD